MMRNPTVTRLHSRISIVPLLRCMCVRVCACVCLCVTLPENKRQLTMKPHSRKHKRRHARTHAIHVVAETRDAICVYFRQEPANTVGERSTVVRMCECVIFERVQSLQRLGGLYTLFVCVIVGGGKRALRAPAPAATATVHAIDCVL